MKRREEAAESGGSRRTVDRSAAAAADLFAKCRLCGWDGHFGDTSEPHLSYHRCPVCKGRELDVRGGGELT